jgi:hypothetical protein
LNSLKEKLSKVDFNLLQTKKILSPVLMNFESIEEFHRKITHDLNAEISNIFLEFYINLFGYKIKCFIFYSIYNLNYFFLLISDLISYIKSKTFNKRSFLDSHHEDDQPFYQQVIFLILILVKIKSCSNY